MSDALNLTQTSKAIKVIVENIIAPSVFEELRKTKAKLEKATILLDKINFVGILYCLSCFDIMSDFAIYNRCNYCYVKSCDKCLEEIGLFICYKCGNGSCGQCINEKGACLGFMGCSICKRYYCSKCGYSHAKYCKKNR